MRRASRNFHIYLHNFTVLFCKYNKLKIYRNRLRALNIRWSQGRVGSTPSSGTRISFLPRGPPWRTGKRRPHPSKAKGAVPQKSKSSAWKWRFPMEPCCDREVPSGLETRIGLPPAQAQMFISSSCSRWRFASAIPESCS